MATILADRKKNFMTTYIDFCKSLNCHPLSFVKVRLPNRTLEFSVDRIKLSDWQPLFRALSEDRSLHLLRLQSNQSLSTYMGHLTTEEKVQALKKVPVLFTGYMMGCLVENLSKSLGSKVLSILDLHQIPLDKDTVKQLCKGLAKNSSIQHFSLHRTLIGDEGCEEICRVIRNRPNIFSLTLIDCNLTKKGAYHISQLIKNQEMARFNESWKHTLRYRELDHAKLPGLRRITLNHNPRIGDEGVIHIADIVMDDLWIKAIDMQDCGISERGFEAIHKLVKTNLGILIFDLRGNNIPIDKIGMLFECLIYNTTNDPSEDYYWMEEGTDDNFSSSASTLSYPTRSAVSIATNGVTCKTRGYKSEVSLPSQTRRPLSTATSPSSTNKKFPLIQKKSGVSFASNGAIKTSNRTVLNSTESSQNGRKPVQTTESQDSGILKLKNGEAVSGEQTSDRKGSVKPKQTAKRLAPKKVLDIVSAETVSRAPKNGIQNTNGVKKAPACDTNSCLTLEGKLSAQLIRGISSVFGPHHAENCLQSRRYQAQFIQNSPPNKRNVPGRILNVSYLKQRCNPKTVVKLGQKVLMNGFNDDHCLINGTAEWCKKYN